MRLLRHTVLLAALGTGVRAVLRRRRGAPPRARARAARPAGPPASGSAASWRGRLKTLALHFALFLGLLGVGGFLVSASGIIPIKASTGHWAVTRWFLEFSSRRSVATHTLGLQAPPLGDADLVLRGAGHYETGCRPCHGAPDLPYPRIAQAMTPKPPYLPETVPAWDPEELFYIVKHGVKLTGMPAWPALERDDEVWAMVAFLLTLPGMDAAGYRRLVEGDAPPTIATAPVEDLVPPAGVPRLVAERCARCHGGEGRARGTGAFPHLAGQRIDYLYAALQAYAGGRRHSGVMEPLAAGLSREEMAALARYYASRTPAAPSPAAPDARASIARGEAVARQGVPAQRIPSCADCHGPVPTRRNPAYPVLAGQFAEYLVLQLELFKQGKRGGSPYARIMHKVVDRLSPEQVHDVARYYASLAPAAPPPPGTERRDP